MKKNDLMNDLMNKAVYALTKKYGFAPKAGKIRIITYVEEGNYFTFNVVDVNFPRAYEYYEGKITRLKKKEMEELEL